MTHNYFEIDLDIVWVAVEQELPILNPKIAAIVQSL
ncbi:MAG: HepT-like ribonuclease domain-containing protein [Cyanophyceae cyanobacterium]